jgi:hypothetical protein
MSGEDSAGEETSRDGVGDVVFGAVLRCGQSLYQTSRAVTICHDLSRGFTS